MRRFDVRPLLFLLAPSVFLLGVGYYLSQKPNFKPSNPHYLALKMETPTLLEAFKGAKSVAVVRVAGRDDVGFYQTNAFLRLQTLEKTLTASTENGSTSPQLRRAWGSFTNTIGSFRSTFSGEKLPPGQLFFGFDATLQHTTFTSGQTPIPISPTRLHGEWKINPQSVAPFDFSKVKRPPLIAVTEMRITAKQKNRLTGIIRLKLQGVAMGEKTLVALENREGSASSSWGTFSNAAKPRSSQERIYEWDAHFWDDYLEQPTAPKNLRFRVSADSRWPLDFDSQTLVFPKLKVGQTLRFSQRLAPLPKR